MAEPQSRSTLSNCVQEYVMFILFMIVQARDQKQIYYLKETKSHSGVEGLKIVRLSH